MKPVHSLFALALTGVCTIMLMTNVQASANPGKPGVNACEGLLDHEVRYLNNSQRTRLCENYGGKLVLVVNTASKCAYTDQYDGLERLYNTYKEEGLVILGFPSNDFGAQEPGSEKQIQDFCRLTYSVNFPMFAKTQVSERNAGPFYQKLAEASGRYPAWNFHKYLIGRDGKLITDFPSHVDPFDRDLVQLIEDNL
jgi:glutathione peroxidase